MRIVNVGYCCISCPENQGRLSLRLGGRHVKLFPMTYTVQDCIEEWCEEVGWKYLFHTGGLSEGGWMFNTLRVEVVNILRVEVGMHGIATNTIINYVRASHPISDRRNHVR